MRALRSSKQPQGKPSLRNWWVTGQTADKRGRFHCDVRAASGEEALRLYDKENAPKYRAFRARCRGEATVTK